MSKLEPNENRSLEEGRRKKEEGRRKKAKLPITNTSATRAYNLPITNYSLPIPDYQFKSIVVLIFFGGVMFRSSANKLKKVDRTPPPPGVDRPCRHRA
ncbi:hypothetical protein QUB05_11220 [Microcoleus sp. F10-C6]|uniref:hypothetical protein n=1 Tax=unclassified Microcoleus TaxID=2642155 RepID=UPI002FD09F60